MRIEKPKVVAYLAGMYRDMIEQNRTPIGAEVSFVNLGWLGQIELMDVAQHERIVSALIPEESTVDWRAHSRNIARGEKCPTTIETLQAAWARDQELIEDQRREIERLKLKLNQERQRRENGPWTGTVNGRAVGRNPVDVLFQYPRRPGKATHLQILKGRTENGEFKMDLDFKPDFAALEKAFARACESSKKAAGGVSNILSRLSQPELELLDSLDIQPVCEQKPKRSERVRDHKRQGKNSGKGPKGRW